MKQCQQQRNKAFPLFTLHLQLQKIKTQHFHKQTTIQSTVKPSVIQKYSQGDYQTFRPVTTSRQTNKQKTSNRNNFSDYNYDFFKKSKTTKPPNMNSQNQPQSQNQNIPQQASQSVFFNDQPLTLDRNLSIFSTD